MAIDKSLVGTSSEPQTFEVTQEAVRAFMEAIDDPELAAHEDAPIEDAPPTFPTTFRIRIPGLELDGAKMQLIHGEQEYTYARRLKVGERVTCIARVVDINEKSGRSGTMTFVVAETLGQDERQQPIFTGRSTLIVRQQ